MSSVGKVYGPAVHPKVRRALATAKLNGVEVEHVQVGLANGDAKKPEYLAKFPLGRVPGFEGPSGFLLTESRAIARYIAAASNNANLLGSDNESAAKIEQWISFADEEIFLTGSAIFRLLGGFVPYNKAAETKYWDVLKVNLSHVEQQLQKSTWLVGERITLADITLASNMRMLYTELAGKEVVASYPNLLRHYHTFVNQPAVKDIYGETEFREENRAFVPPKKEAAPKPAAAAAAPKAAKAPKAKKEAEDDDDEPLVPAEPKTRNPLDDLPKSSFNLEDWKRIYSNKDTYKEALPWFYENFDAEGYSIWRIDYKYNDELTQVFMSSNLIGGFFSRLEASRKYVMGSAGVFGENNASAISGVIVLRGQDWKPVLSVAPDIDSYDVKPVDLKDAAQKKYFEDVLAWEAELDGKKWADGKQLK